mgnify:CR=1 FL=1
MSARLPYPVYSGNPERFAVSLAKARRHDGRIAAYVSGVSPEDALRMAAKDTRFLVIQPCTDSGFYYPAGAYLTADGYLGGLYSRRPGYGSQIVAKAVELGARKLDCLGDDLAALYERHGFRETFRAPWDDSQAPADWNDRPERPDYIEMERN